MSVEFTTLPSGLRVVTDAAAHLRTTSLGVFISAGSRHESDQEHGLSHLLEHMAFKGTRRRNAREIAEAIENAGGDLNAETGVEQTAYFARVLGDDVDLALDVLADILTESQFDPDELGREKNVIIQEIGAVEDTPDDLVFDYFTAAAWPEQPIGRPILGTREGVSAFNRDAIDAYLRHHYRSGAMVVAAAGAVDHDRLVARAEALLKGLGGDSAEPPKPAAYRGGDILVKKKLEQTHLVVGFEGRAIQASDHDAAHVFAAATGGGMSSRLFQEVREKRGLAYSIYAFHWAYSDSGLFGFYAGAAAKDVGELARAALDCLAEASQRLDEDEIRRARAQLKVSTLTALESPSARAHQLARQTFVYGRPLSLEDMLARIDAISVEDVRRVGAAMLTSTPTVAAIGGVGKALDSAGVAARLGRV
ncbi:MAG: insulinase family protein [Hyphomicrobiales bacterium]|nr:insulinase family protein [Hyphomicrobiales bacterium]MBV8663213.1 insulinase family protein [Hyphomicrobiales bacterium]